MFGHQYFALSSLYVLCVLGCPVAGVVCAHVMGLPQRSGGTHSRDMVHRQVGDFLVEVPSDGADEAGQQ